MKIAAIQFAPELGQPGRTRERLSPLLDGTRDADLVVLPELANSGYDFVSKEQAAATAEPLSESPFVEMLTGHAKKNDQHVVAGINERNGDKLFNSSVLIGPQGLVGVYRKVHLFNAEKLIFTAGDTVSPVFEVGGTRIGMAICFDWAFPELWRTLALRGADVICHPSNLVIPKNCQRAIPVHAMINRMFIVTANRIGSEGKLHFTGNSIITDPRGRILGEASASEEETVTASIDPSEARSKKITERNDLLADRRPETYEP